ncbi:MAG: FliA/WhiG family RNA polymerase sigma factor [Planctomycetes bacterium]|nr:FliA/WhiG family RNA polymerase sigma factor [Planctomycetota bacterium]
MSPKKSSAAKKSAPVPPPAEPRLRLVEGAKPSRVQPLAGAPRRAQPAAETPPAEQTTEEIWARYHKARKAKKPEDIERLRNLLMERHQPLVRYIAERQLQTLPKSIDIDDLISWGNFGLMDAIRGFEPERNIKFKTYCTMRIRGSILDHLRSQDWVPRLVRLKASRIERAYQKLTGEYGREPTHAELAAELQMEHDELATEISSANAKAMFSLSEKWEDREDDSSVEKVDVLEDRRATDPIGELNKRDMMHFLTRSLTHKERFIIEQYYQVGHTMREIGEMLALTESRVCQIHSNVMLRLKDLLGQKSGTLLL